MKITDPISDMLTRIRNANAANKAEVAMPSTKVLVEVARVICEEGYIAGYEAEDTTPQKTLHITLKYGPKKQKVINIKEVKLRPNIEQHDFDVKLKNALRFVEEGNKVKVTIMFRGRELSHPELGKEVLSRVAAARGDAVSIERNAKLEGKNMTMIVAPKVQKSSKKKSQKTQTKGGNSNAEN